MSRVLEIDHSLFREYLVRNEDEYEVAVGQHQNSIFGSFRFESKKIKFSGSLGSSIPDGLAFRIDAARKRIEWLLVEVEIQGHDALLHIIPQLQRFRAFEWTFAQISKVEELLPGLPFDVGRALMYESPKIHLVIDKVTPVLSSALQGLGFDVLVTEASLFRDVNGKRCMMVVDGLESLIDDVSVGLLSSPRSIFGYYRFVISLRNFPMKENEELTAYYRGNAIPARLSSTRSETSLMLDAEAVQLLSPELLMGRHGKVPSVTVKRYSTDSLVLRKAI